MEDNWIISKPIIDNNYTKNLDYFLQNIKPLIDTYFSENPFTAKKDKNAIENNFEINKVLFEFNIQAIERHRKVVPDFKYYANKYENKARRHS